MAIYEFRCTNCGNEVEKFRPMADYDKPLQCDVCKHQMKRLISNVLSPDIKNKRYSGAMGVNISQIEEAKRAYPGSEYNKRGDLLIKSRKHKLFEMKRRGMVEFE